MSISMAVVMKRAGAKELQGCVEKVRLEGSVEGVCQNLERAGVVKDKRMTERQIDIQRYKIRASNVSLAAMDPWHT